MVTLISSKCSDEIVSWKKDSHGRIVSILIRSNGVEFNCCRRQLHIGKRSMVFGSIVRSIVRIRKQPMKKPVI